MDDDLGSVALEAVADDVGGIKVERSPIPGDRSCGTGEWGVLESLDERPAESTAGARDGDPHQSWVGVAAAALGVAAASVGVGAAAALVANRWAY